MFLGGRASTRFTNKQLGQCVSWKIISVPKISIQTKMGEKAQQKPKQVKQKQNTFIPEVLCLISLKFKLQQ